ncbi:MAG: dTMP kinase [Acidobacteriota bacterium]|nr:dTMP kinase [Acidobacteriota bacterium]MDQ5871030.1 dTMP kinase [Acidobacteriota bacterium]
MPFVTFEGVEGSGKSTQLKLAAARLRERRRPVFVTREPGGTRIGRILRGALLPSAHRELDSVAEWLLFEADRRQHVIEVLRPALERGRFVLCDRFSDATEAYQQVGRRLDARLVRRVDALARDGLVPDLTLLFDLDPGDGLARAKRRGGRSVGRFEKTGLEFHEKVRRAYLAIARREPERVRVLDAGQPVDRLFRDTWRALTARFPV